MTTNTKAPRDEKSARWRKKHAERIKAQAKEWRQKNKHKQKAHRIFRKALLAGEIAKAKFCSECGDDSPLEAHHRNYDLPLVVQWLCKPCHRKEHGGVAVGIPKRLVTGVEHHSAKLNEKLVQEIRAALSSGNVVKRELARRYGVSECLIRQIERREIWKNV